MIINITSPTRGEKYTLEEVLRKGYERSSLFLEAWEFKKLHTCFYGSIDGILTVERFQPSPSRWTDSVSFQVNGNIPVHFTEGGKMSIGFGCGCDTKYHGQFPGQDDPNNPQWEEYKKISNIFGIGINTDTQATIVTGIEALRDEPSMKILAEILQVKIAEGAILGTWTEGDK